MSNYYDEDDYELELSNDDFLDGFTLSDEELDQYEDVKENELDEIEYQIRYAEERIVFARCEGYTQDEVERLEDELEVLMIDYMRAVERGE